MMSKYCKEAYGIDHSEAVLRKGVNNIAHLNNVKVSKMSAYELEFQENFFDQTCCMFNTFGNMKNEKAVLDEMVRTTKPGGHVIFSVFNLQSIPERLEFYQKTTLDDAHAEGIVIRSGNNFFSKTYSDEDIRRMCKVVGLENVIIHQTRIAYVCEATKK